MAGPITPAPGEAARAEDETGREPAGAPGTIALESITFRSTNARLKACSDDAGWKNTGSPCPAPEWTPAAQRPLSHTMGERLRLALTLRIPEPPADVRPLGIHGRASGGLVFGRDDLSPAPGSLVVTLVSTRALETRIARLALDVAWSAAGAAALSTAHTENVVYVTMGRPREDQQDRWQEDGVTLKRMDRAVAWVAPLRTLRPHSIVRALMDKFPHYALHPSPDVPRAYHHPTYFNDEGGAWAMSDHVAASGECQAIVRLVRGILRQLGVPGRMRVLVVWGDPEVGGGQKALSADWEESPSGGLDRMKMVNDQRWLATLVDEAVEEGKTYPASHTPRDDGSLSPGFNRFEACLEFTHGGVTRYYGGGAGVLRTKEEVLRVFWGLVWVTASGDDGFRVEKIVARYGGEENS